MSGASPSPVDWELAERVARVVAGKNPIGDSYLASSLAGDFEAATREAEALVAEFTGLRAPGRARSGVVDRHEWVGANIRALRSLLTPLMDRLADRLAANPFSGVGRRVAGTEMGVLLGYLGQRVLGQYDLLVPDDAGATDCVYYVGPNVLTLEKRFAFRPRDFRLWIALHEVTHRAQFTGVPWMRGYFLGLVEETMGLVEPDPQRVVRALREAAEELRAGRNPLDGGGLVALVATPEQRGLIGQVQALMSLLEGHGNFVMNRLGAVHVAGQERMARVLQARRRARGLRAQLQRLLGLEMKLRQYEVGERFVEVVAEEAGVSAIDAAWRGPEWLPTMPELEDPGSWLTRVEAPTAAPGAR